MGLEVIMAIVHANDENFKTCIATDVVLVDFYANWCGPCRALAPILEELSEEGKVTVIKVNVDEAEKTAKEFGIMSIPTLITFRDGKEQKKQIGLVSKEEIEEMISES